MKEKLEEYIPTIINHIDETTLQEVYNKSLNRLSLLENQKKVNPESKINALSFVEYIIVADYENSTERQHYVREIDKAFQILVSNYPPFYSNLKKVAARLLKAMNTKDVFNNLLDWQNIAVELLITANLWHNNGVEIKDIEYDLINGKSIDLFVKHHEYGELLCEFRSIHISLETSKSGIKKSVKKLVTDKIKDKTKDLDLLVLPAPLAFLFVIQLNNAEELTPEILKSLNDIVFEEKVLPLMICRLGRTKTDNKELFEIVQIKHLIDKE